MLRHHDLNPPTTTLDSRRRFIGPLLRSALLRIPAACNASKLVTRQKPQPASLGVTPASPARAPEQSNRVLPRKTLPWKMPDPALPSLMPVLSLLRIRLSSPGSAQIQHATDECSRPNTADRVRMHTDYVHITVSICIQPPHTCTALQSLLLACPVRL